MAVFPDPVQKPVIPANSRFLPRAKLAAGFITCPLSGGNATKLPTERSGPFAFRCNGQTGVKGHLAHDMCLPGVLFHLDFYY